MSFPSPPVPQVMRLVFRRVLRPDKEKRRDRGTLLDQFPRLRQMIEQATAKDRVEVSKAA